MKKNPEVFLFLSLFIIYAFLGWVTIDPDFGWRIRMGQLILSKGIPQTDPFSFTMMKYPFVDHEWLTHVFLFMLYKQGGRILLSFVFAIVVVLAVFCTSFSKQKEKRKNNWIVSVFVFLIGSSILSMSGIRPQVWGWFLLVLWINELRKGSLANVFFLCILQVVWVNTHGSFFLGISTSLLYYIALFVQKKGTIKHLGVVALLFCLTLINPYGWHIWREVWMSLSDTALRWRVQEWLPGAMILDAAFWFYCVIFFSLFLQNWRRVLLFEKLLSLFFFLSSLSAARNMPLFLLVSFPFFLQMWTNLEGKIPTNKRKHFFLLTKTLIIACFFIGIVRIGNTLIHIKPTNKIYPVEAVAFIARQKIRGRIYSEYGWGGYIIWKAPTVKVFIDGRMPSWRWKQNNPKQSNNIEEEYIYITTKAQSFEPYKKKYSITHALVRKKKNEQLFQQYKKIYEDELSVVYEL